MFVEAELVRGAFVELSCIVKAGLPAGLPPSRRLHLLVGHVQHFLGAGHARQAGCVVVEVKGRKSC